MDGKVSFVDLRAQHEEVRQEIEGAISDIIDRSAFVGGSYVTNFEAAFAEYLGVKAVVAVGNGTDALWLALQAAGTRPGDLILTVANTFIATAEAIARIGAEPVFLDVDVDTYTLSPQALEAFLHEQCAASESGEVIHKASRKRVAGVLPVHLYGLPVNLEKILPLCEAYHLPLFEDACQAHGASLEWGGSRKKAGSFGLAAGFSFYPSKNLGAMGEGGAVATNDLALADQVRWLREHGSREKYIHHTAGGWNCRMDAIQAAVLTAKLKRLDDWNAHRRAAAKLYEQALRGLPLALPCEIEGSEHVYHLYVVRSEKRAALQKQLAERGIGTGIHYPIPLHKQQAFTGHAICEPLAATEYVTERILSLPMHQSITEAQIQFVGDACKEILLG